MWLARTRIAKPLGTRLLRGNVTRLIKGGSSLVPARPHRLLSTTAAEATSTSSAVPLTPHLATATVAAGRAANHSWRRIGAFVAVGVTSSAYTYYHFVLGPRLSAPDAELVEIPPPPPPEEFEHPHTSGSWYWKAYFIAKRCLYLTVLFVPVMGLGLVSRLTQSERIRQYFLDSMLSAIESAGCGVQKFAQWLSMRPDVLGPDVIRTLAKLRDDVPAHSYEHTRRMIRESLGKEIEELFEEFDPKPVASGTVAQVHRARLRPEYASALPGAKGLEVAVKVRHPHVLDETYIDIDVMFSLLERSKLFTVPFSKTEFLHTLQKQIDFQWEAFNLNRFAHNFRHEMASGQVSFPMVSNTLLAPSILVETWASGSSVSGFLSEVGDNFRSLAKNVEDTATQFSEQLMQQKRTLAKTVFDVNMKMFLRDNLVHGDLHGGNVLFDESRGVCTVLDAGLTTSVEPEHMAGFGQFLHALCTGNTEVLVDRISEFCTPANYHSARPVEEAVVSVETKEAFRVDLEATLAKFIGPDGLSAPDGSPISLGDVMAQLLFALERHEIKLVGDVASSIVTMSVSEGLIRALDPEFDCVKSSLPYFLRFGTFQAKPK